MIRITGIGDRDRPEWLIRISGMRKIALTSEGDADVVAPGRIETEADTAARIGPQAGNLPSIAAASTVDTSADGAALTEGTEEGVDARDHAVAAPTTTLPAAGPEAPSARDKGASGPQIAEATGWAAHTVRGFLAGLAKKGIRVEVLERVHQVGPNKQGAKGSYTAYRMAAEADE